MLLTNYYVILTRTAIHVENMLQQAGHPIGVKHSENQSLLKGFKCRLGLNISKHYRFPIPARFESEYACALTSSRAMNGPTVRRTLAESFNLKTHRIRPQWAYQRLLQKQNRPRKFIKIYKNLRRCPPQLVSAVNVIELGLLNRLITCE